MNLKQGLQEVSHVNNLALYTRTHMLLRQNPPPSHSRFAPTAACLPTEWHTHSNTTCTACLTAHGHTQVLYLPYT